MMLFQVNGKRKKVNKKGGESVQWVTGSVLQC